jgi:hypothetical protein
MFNIGGFSYGYCGDRSSVEIVTRKPAYLIVFRSDMLMDVQYVEQCSGATLRSNCRGRRKAADRRATAFRSGVSAITAQIGEAGGLAAAGKKKQP